MVTGFLRHGSCTIQPSQIAFPSDELQSMVHRCGLNRLNQFSTFIAGHFRKARENPKLLADLQMLDSILYSGLPMPQEEADWAYKNGLKLSVSEISFYLASMQLLMNDRISLVALKWVA